MVAVSLLEYHSGPMTLSDLADLPDDGRRFELIDGMLFVSPAPGVRHQTVVRRMLLALEAARPPDLRVHVAPLDVVLADDAVLQPDLLVARLSDFGEENLPVPPMLAVEVLSPSSRLYDLNTKKARYEAAGVAWYWVVDPDAVELTGWELRSGGYVEVARVSGAEPFTTSVPFDVTLVPADLVEP